jgi:hypothetical protein
MREMRERREGGGRRREEEGGESRNINIIPDVFAKRPNNSTPFLFHLPHFILINKGE